MNLVFFSLRPRPYIHEGKDQHMSCTVHHGEPLLCPCLKPICSFLVIFLGWVILPHYEATSTDHSGPRTSDLSIERRRRNHFKTAPTTAVRRDELYSSYVGPFSRG